MATFIDDNKDTGKQTETTARIYVNTYPRDAAIEIVASVKPGVTKQIWLETEQEISHFAHEVIKGAEQLTNRFPVKLPKIGTKISVPEIVLDIDELWYPATVCIHDRVQKPMVTIIPLGKEPWYILSPWGNGPGIVAFLQDYKKGEKVFQIEIVSHPEQYRSVDAIVLPVE